MQNRCWSTLVNCVNISMIRHNIILPNVDLKRFRTTQTCFIFTIPIHETTLKSILTAVDMYQCVNIWRLIPVSFAGYQIILMAKIVRSYFKQSFHQTTSHILFYKHRDALRKLLNRKTTVHLFTNVYGRRQMQRMHIMRSKVWSFRREQLGWWTFPAMLNSLFTGTAEAGIARKCSASVSV